MRQARIVPSYGLHLFIKFNQAPTELEWRGTNASGPFAALSCKVFRQRFPCGWRGTPLNYFEKLKNARCGGFYTCKKFRRQGPWQPGKVPGKWLSLLYL